MSFESRIEEMNLTNIGNGRYFYGDRFGQIIYSKIQTFSSINMVGSNETLPMIAIYTRRSTNDNYLFCGIVSNSYKFYGNARLNQEVLNSINSAGQPVLRENTIQSKKLTEFRNEIIIRNAKNIREIGNVYPIIIIENSYAGTKAARFIFGFGILENNIVRCIPFRSMGTIKQVHQIGRAHV